MDENNESARESVDLAVSLIQIAHREREETLSQARTEAATIIVAARNEAADIISTARAEAEAELTRINDEAAIQRASLSAAREETLAELESTRADLTESISRLKDFETEYRTGLTRLVAAGRDALDLDVDTENTVNDNEVGTVDDDLPDAV